MATAAAVTACVSPYENARNQRVEENKRRLEELGLTGLTRDLSNAASPSSPSPGRGCTGKPRPVKERVTLQLRRSTRNLGGIEPDYVEVEVDVRRRARFDNTGGTRHYSRLYERKYASDEARAIATGKAEALKKELPQTHASMVKPMLQSHVTGGFWLGLPVAFCRDYLPRKDDRIVLEDENGDEWETIYLATKTGLSGGWRGFSLDHGLVDGDALVFELVEPKRFKVHIIRVYGDSGSAELDNVVKQQGQGKINKVRQKLIWECNTPDTVAEDRGSDITEVADKPCRMESDILKCSDVSIASTMEADDACHDCKDEMSYKRRKTEDGHYVNCDTKLDHGITARGISLGANAVKEDSERPNQTSYITDFMRSRKQTDGNVKKESCDIPCF